MDYLICQTTEIDLFADDTRGLYAESNLNKCNRYLGIWVFDFW